MFRLTDSQRSIYHSSGMFVPANHVRSTSPYSLAPAGTVEQFTATVLAVMQRFSWWDVTALWDESDKGGIYGMFCNLLVQQAKAIQNFRISAIPFNAKNKETFSDVLRKARLRSRGEWCLWHGNKPSIFISKHTDLYNHGSRHAHGLHRRC